jgi:ankyrin repeat protein
MKHGAEIGEPGNDGATSITLAMEADGIEMVMLLRRYGANTNHPNANGRALFLNAVEANRLEKVGFLLKYSTESNTEDADGVTPLTCADKLNPPNVVKHTC